MKWEYRTWNFTAWLNEQGKRGWELISFTNDVAIFKRRRVEDMSDWKTKCSRLLEALNDIKDKVDCNNDAGSKCYFIAQKAIREFEENK